MKRLQKKKAVVFGAAVSLLISAWSAWAGPADTVVEANINIDSKNTGNITSISGGDIKGGGILGFKGRIGSAEGTETNVNSVVIGPGAKVKGKLNVKAENKGKITNLGSKLNVGSIRIGK